MIGLIKGTARQAKTVSGLPLPIASYKSNSKLPIQELSLSINPTQSGSGDPAPDNIRPITGVSSVNVARTGKNICSVSSWEGKAGHAAYFDNIIKAGTPITISALFTRTGTSSSACACAFYYTDGTDGQNTPFRVNTGERVYKTVTPDKDVNRLYFYSISGSWSQSQNYTLTVTDLQIELGSTASDYEPYNGNTYTIALGDTYYGATLDVVRGKLTITYGFVDLGDLSWLKDTTVVSGKTIFRSSLSAKTTFNAICSNYKFVGAYTNLTDKTCCYIYNTWIGIEDSTYNESTAEQFKTAMSGAQLVYELAEPIEIDLTPTQINSLLGQNNIWHDGNGDVESLKFMDRQLYFGR